MKPIPMFRKYMIDESGVIISRYNGKPLKTSRGKYGGDKVYLYSDNGKKSSRTVRRLIEITYGELK